MIDTSVLNILAGVSTPLGLISIAAYLFSLRIVQKNERSVKEALSGENLINKDLVLQILERFSDDKTRLDALHSLIELDKTNPDSVLKKLESVEIVKIYNISSTNFKNISGIAAIFFIIISIVSLGISWLQGPKPPTIIEKKYSFNGPYRISRDKDNIVFNLTNAINDKELSEKSIQIESIAVVGDISEESNDPFGFDLEILAFGDQLSPNSPIYNNKNYETYLKTRNGYVPPRRVVQVTLRTDESREPHSTTPLKWAAELNSGLTLAGETKSIRDSTIATNSNGLYLQMFIWTLWGGSHFVEFSKFDITVKMKIL
ncbi:MAG TPA: hypothetical protein PKC79_05180 [Solidesulfovibrio magneticus]|nr:hypothetical protein [Solidesulfovibrio magneticus]